jgi:hypothetical protein
MGKRADVDGCSCQEQRKPSVWKFRIGRDRHREAGCPLGRQLPVSGGLREERLFEGRVCLGLGQAFEMERLLQALNGHLHREALATVDAFPLTNPCTLAD